MVNILSGVYNSTKNIATSKVGKIAGMVGITATISLWAGDYAIKNYDSHEKREFKRVADEIVASMEGTRSFIEKEQGEAMSIILMRDFRTGKFDAIIVPTRFHENFSAEKDIDADSKELKYAMLRSDAVKSFPFSYVNTKGFSVYKNQDGHSYSMMSDYRILSRSYFDHTEDGDDFSLFLQDSTQPGKYNDTTYNVVSISPSVGNNIIIQKGLLAIMKNVFTPTAKDVMEGAREKSMGVIQSSQDVFTSESSELTEDSQD